MADIRSGIDHSPACSGLIVAWERVAPAGQNVPNPPLCSVGERDVAGGVALEQEDEAVVEFL
ncbi:MAG: hypothetical protein AAGK32_00660, partial [Actinomycetota bacterium]